jgi:peptidoglycan/xylan/chitin deacetylase (PgdA/CDA1 family)
MSQITSELPKKDIPTLVESLTRHALEADPAQGQHDEEVLDPSYRSLDGVREVALTFDDGPRVSTTTPILDTLAASGIKATFFVIGKNAEKDAGKRLIERMLTEGHTVGNHTWTHPHMKRCSESQLRDELGKTQELLESLGVTTKYWRSPRGARNARIRRVARELGLDHVGWDVDPKDWSPKNRSLAWVTKALADMEDREDSCLVLHDIRPTTAKHLPALLEELEGERSSGRLVYVNEF